ncbi:MAG: radical SAM protein, partial [Spirochaetales bacterium]
GRGGAPLRLARLAKAAEVQGFWPCLLAEGAKMAKAEGRPHTTLAPLVLNGPSASSARLSITSGCPGYCSFCLEGWDRRPYAEADIDRLLAEARKLRRATGAVDLEIYSFNFNTHSRIFDLIFELNRVFRRVSFMSQRLDILAETRGLIEVELAGGKRSFTLGIEGISESMRAYYRKGLTADHIETCLQKTIRPGIKELKLFFIIAGTETTADIAEFAALMESIKRRKDANSPSTRILVSAGFLVRLPFTPLQFAPLEFDRDKLVRLGHLLGEACDQSSIEFRLASDVEESFVDQALSLGGDAAFRWLEKIPSLGFKYDVSLGEGTWKSLKPFIFGKGSDSSFVEEKSEDYRPPLAFIEENRGFALLRAHYLEAKNLVDRFSCLGKDCSACGVCEDKADRSAMTDHELIVPPLIRHTEKIEALLSAKSKFAPVIAAIDFPLELADAHPSYRTSWLLRRFSETVEGAENILFEVKEILFSGSSPFAELVGDEIGRFGRSAIALFGPDPKRMALLLSKFALAEASSGSGKRKADSRYCIGLKPLAAPPSPLHVDLEIKLPEDRLDDLRGAFEAFGSSQKLPFTTRREENGWDFIVSDASKSRRILAQASLRKIDTLAILSLEAGEKARLSPLFKLIEERCGSRPLLRVVGWN